MAQGQGPTLEAAALDLVTKTCDALANTSTTEQTPESDLAAWLHETPKDVVVDRVTRMLAHDWAHAPKGTPPDRKAA